jgi:hypothetical protein
MHLLSTSLAALPITDEGPKHPPMHDDEVSRALIAEIEAMAAFNEWMLAHIGRPECREDVQEAVHRMTRAHQLVIATHDHWKNGGAKSEVLAACEAFTEQVAALVP